MLQKSSARKMFCAEGWKFWMVKWYIQYAGNAVFTKLPACCVFRKKFSCAESCAEDFLVLCLEFILLFANKKRAILAYHPECLHNGIILIVYILQICCCIGSAFF